MNEKQHVFIIGCKGIPAKYGGYETFVDKLTQYRKSDDIVYHVACAVEDISKEPKEFIYNGAECFNIEWKKIGAAKAIFYDIDAIKWSIKFVKNNKIKHPIFYVLACRIGPFIGFYKKKISSLGGKLFVNPDGHEWMRAKWSKPVRRYWKISEELMVKWADLLVCDSKNIEKYIHEEYYRFNPKTTFIAYGSDTKASNLKDDDEGFTQWLQSKDIKPKEYYLIVGRFVPENNYETMIREFMKSNVKKSFVIVTNINNSFIEELKKKTQFDTDSRIKFVGTVYDQELLKKIREKAYAYLHGHEVGGTNPSLLEALGSTDVNLLLNVGFNREVAEDGALYWDKEENNLASLINYIDKASEEEIKVLGKKAKQRIKDLYSWDYIIDEYENLILSKRKDVKQFQTSTEL